PSKSPLPSLTPISAPTADETAVGQPGDGPKQVAPAPLPIGKGPGKETPVKETPVKDTPVKDTPVITAAPLPAVPADSKDSKHAPATLTPALVTEACPDDCKHQKFMAFAEELYWNVHGADVPFAQ